jgi:hypothetical protein
MHIGHLLAIGSAFAGLANAYAVKTPPLDTIWTSQVGTNPWPQHPRPKLQRPQWQSLNGIWTYRIEEEKEKKKKEEKRKKKNISSFPHRFECV